MHHLRTLYDFFLGVATAIRFAFFPTLRAIVARPSMLRTPRTVSRVFMDAVWTQWGPGTDAKARPSKEKLLVGNLNERVRGVVLDVGAGHGHLVYYLDRSRVTTYIALEPNPFMLPHIRKAANKEGYNEEDGSLLVVPFGVEDTDEIQDALKAHYNKFYASKPSSESDSDASIHLATGQVNTIVSILTFCSVPNPQQTLISLVSHILAPGGTLLFFEHVKNPIPSVALCQQVLGKIWKVFFDGCVLGQDTVRMVRNAGDACGGWESMVFEGEEGQDVEAMFLNVVGFCVKKK